MVKTNKTTSQGYLLLNGEANGSSELINLDTFSTIKFDILTTGLTAGTTLLIEASLDNVNWLIVDTTLLEDNARHEYISVGMARPFYRTTILNYTGGSISVKYFATD